MGVDHRAGRSRVLRDAVAIVERAQTALHGILAALYERERSGLGQRVDATMMQALRRSRPVERDRSATSSPSTRRRSRRRGSSRPALGTPSNPLFYRLAGRAVGRRALDAVLADHATACSVRSCACSSSTGCSTIPSGRTSPTSTTIEQRHEYFEHDARRGPGQDRRRVAWRCSTGTRRVGRDLPPRHRAARPPAAGARPIGRHRRRSRARRGAPARAHGPPGGDPRRGRPVGARARPARARLRARARGRRRARRPPRSRRRRAAARRRHRARARDVLRGALRRDAAHRPRRPRHQDRAARRRPHPPHHPVPRGRRGEGAAGQGERRRRHPHRRRTRDRPRARAAAPTRCSSRSAPAWSSASGSTPTRCWR